MSTAEQTRSRAPQRQKRDVQWRDVAHDIAAGSVVRSIAAVFLSLVLAAILIIFTNEDVIPTLGYLFQRPSDFFNAAGQTLVASFSAMFRGAIFNTSAPTFEAGIKPFTESLRFAGPLIAAGLGIALTFRAGLFNIGGQGQLLTGAAWAAWGATMVHLPPVLHLLFAILMGLVGAALWAGIAGFLKAKTGAHEVIVTIMMNYVALGLVTFAMRSPILNGTGEGSAAVTLPPDANALFPRLFGPGFELRWSFVLCILAVFVYWWLMERSALGFRLRMVGLNPDAARAAGVNVQRAIIVAMVLSGAFVGIAAVNQALGRDGNFGPGIDAGIGFTAITVALLGGSRALGVLFAGLLFGAPQAARPAMQVVDVSPEILGVVQGLIVLFIAAPPLVRAIFPFLPAPREIKDIATGARPQLDRKDGE